MQAYFEWFDPNTPNKNEEVSLVVRCSRAEAEALLGYDLNSATSPPAAESRALARPLVAAAQAARSSGVFPAQE